MKYTFELDGKTIGGMKIETTKDTLTFNIEYSEPELLIESTINILNNMGYIAVLDDCIIKIVKPNLNSKQIGALVK